MDTKSRNYSHSALAKVIAFLVVVACFTSMVVISAQTLDENKDAVKIWGTTDALDNPEEDNYYLSANYALEVENIMNDLIEISTKYKSQEYIKTGKTVNQEEFESQKEDLYGEFVYTKSNSDEYPANYEENYKNLKKDFEVEYREKIEQVKHSLIEADLKDFNSSISRLNQKKGLAYYVKKDENIYSSTENDTSGDFKKYPAYIVSEAGEYKLAPEKFEQSEYYGSIYSNAEENLYEVDSLKIGFTKDYIEQREYEWEQMKEETKESREIVRQLVYKLLAMSLVILAGLIYLIIVTGRKGFKGEQLKMSSIDKLYTDVNLLIIITIILIWVGISVEIFRSIRGNLSLLFLGVGSALACALVLTLLLSFVRHMKNKSIFSHSLLFVLVLYIKKLSSLGKDIYRGGNIVKKVTLAILVFAILIVLTIYMFPITVGVAIWLAHKKTKDYIKIKEGVEKIKSGQIDHKIEIENDGEFKSLAEDINSIGEGFNSAIENELKSERLKTELITNVSHDIRTPLTSIITYIDLMKNEKDQKKLDEYIGIIEGKSQRLKKLTDDLFEASKATSGNIPVNFEKIDLVSLITQGLGELDTQVRESGLDFKINNFTEKIYVNADGRLLWRAI